MVDVIGVKHRERRDGVRGGKDTFTWETVKDDRCREWYIGHSLNAPFGRWCKGKDLSWFGKKNKYENNLTKNSIQEEKELLKEKEERLMKEALGLTPKQSHDRQELDAYETRMLFGKGNIEHDQVSEIDRIEGLGYIPSRHHEIPLELKQQHLLNKMKNQLSQPQAPTNIPASINQSLEDSSPTSHILPSKNTSHISIAPLSSIPLGPAPPPLHSSSSHKSKKRHHHHHSSKSSKRSHHSHRSHHKSSKH